MSFIRMFFIMLPVSLAYTLAYLIFQDYYISAVPAALLMVIGISATKARPERGEHNDG